MISVWLRSIAQRYLDVTMSVGGGFEARILERPGYWMQQPQCNQLVSDLQVIAAANLGDAPIEYGIFDTEGSALEHSIITVIYREEDRTPVAFSALPVLTVELDGRSVEVQHLGLVMIDPTVQKQGFAWVLYGLTCFLLYLRNQMRPIWISSVTQVPAVVGMVAETFSSVYPAARGEGRRTFAHLQLARQIATRHRAAFGVGKDAEFDEQRFIIRNAYTGGSDNLKKTYEEAAKHRDDTYNDYCRTVLDYDRGDDVLQLAQLDLAAAGHYLVKIVPGRSLGPLLVSAVIMLLQYVTLPVVHWLDSRREWGRLRPW